MSAITDDARLVSLRTVCCRIKCTILDFITTRLTLVFVSLYLAVLLRGHWLFSNSAHSSDNSGCVCSGKHTRLTNLGIQKINTIMSFLRLCTGIFEAPPIDVQINLKLFSSEAKPKISNENFTFLTLYIQIIRNLEKHIFIENI